MINKEIIEEFDSALLGDLILEGDESYDEARSVWNEMIDKNPAYVVRCEGAVDVVECVNFAREHELPLAIRGGGHNVAGDAMCDDGLVIDLSKMKGIRVDSDDNTVRAEGGVTWRELDRETQIFGLAVPGGVVSTTGIAGLTLGGGVGWLRRKYGMTIDSLLSVDIVTADGELLTASKTQNSDLFWALRGGGGNFGVVTSFEFKLYPVGPDVMFAGVMYPLEQASDILPAWRDFMKKAPEEISSQAVFWSVPAVPDFPEETHGLPVIVLVALHCGPVAEGEEKLQPLRELGDIVIDLSGPTSYTQVQQLYDPFFPEGELHYYWKSIELEKLDDEVTKVIIEAAKNRPSARTLIPVWHYGGKMNRVEGSETAYGDRNCEFLLSIDSTWKDPSKSGKNIQWTRNLWNDLHQYSSGGLYLNFPGFGEEGQNLLKAAYGNNYQRLIDIKTKYDPDNLFHINQNIRPKS